MTKEELVAEFKNHDFDFLEELRDELDEVISDKENEDEDDEE